MDPTQDINTNTNATTNNNNDDKKPMDSAQNKKKRSSMNIIRVVLYLMRRRSKVKTQSDIASKGFWKKIISAVRPLNQTQLPPSQSSPNLILEVPSKELPNSFSLGGMSPCSSSSCPSPSPSLYASAINLHELDKSPSPSPSRYASAPNLQDLDKTEGENNEGMLDIDIEDGKKNEGQGRPKFEIVVEDDCEADEEDENACFDGEGDEMIDAKAEEFIAQFYEQMRLQTKYRR